jgi:methionyl-tRNA formyltransferase
MRYVFAGDRDLSVEILRHLIANCGRPLALLVSGEDRASHSEELIELSGIDEELVFRGKDFLSDKALAVLTSCRPDYIIGIHFPYIIPAKVLGIPSVGFLNLHPAFLPYNRGWHTPTWAILEGTPIGATLHFMSEGLDVGDIVHQKQIIVRPDHTAHSLYADLKALEIDVFKEALPALIELNPVRKCQPSNGGTSHKRQDLFRPEIQEIQLNQTTTAAALLLKLRALTTSSVQEAAYFVVEGVKYHVQVIVSPEDI